MATEVPLIICSVNWHAVLTGCVYCAGALLQFAAIVGCIVPILPGPALALAGLSLLYCTPTRPALPVMLLAVVAVAIAFVLDYVVPSLGAKVFNCSKAGVFGCFVGSIYGLVAGTIAGLFTGILLGSFLVLLGIVVFSFIGTFIGEAYSNKEFWPSVRGAFGSFAGFVVGTIVKMVLTAFVAALFAGTVMWPLIRNAFD